VEDLISGGLVGLVLVVLIVAVMESRRYWAIVDTPTIPAGHAFPGVIEVFGKAGLGMGHSIISPLSGANCAWVQWRISGANERNERTTVSTITSNFQVYVSDDTGEVTVYLGNHAPIDAIEERFAQAELPSVSGGMLRAFANGMKPNRIAAPSDGDQTLAYRAVMGQAETTSYNSYLDLSVAAGDWSIVERRIEIGDPLYVLGSASVHPDGGPLLLAAELGELLAFRGSEQGLTKQMRMLSLSLFAGFIALTAGATSYVYALLRRTSPTDALHIQPAKALIGGWFAFLLVMLMQSVRVRNRVVAAREQVFSSTALIDVALAKRASLLPALNQIAIETSTYERETFVDVSRQRSENMVGNLAVLVEASPSLKANDAFNHLFEQAVAVENELAAARGYHVDACTVLRNRLQTFPDSWLALFAGAMPEMPELDTRK
jgi:LemA protein